MSLDKFGFIITRHVNSEKTNRYWNLCIRRIRHYYNNKIVVIDDKSNPEFLKADFEYRNIEYVTSEFPGRGELLPYYYFHKNKYFHNAVILHDSVFIHRKIKFDKFVLPIIPIWHFDNIQKSENASNSLRLTNVLTNKDIIQRKLTADINKHQILNISSLNPIDDSTWYGCFGCMTYISHNFLTRIENKYRIFNLLQVVTNRPDRCCLERIMGIIFCTEYPELLKIKSLFGNILLKDFGYTFERYCNDLTRYKTTKYAFVKVWTGR
jgi:hypothetical protein